MTDGHVAVQFLQVALVNDFGDEAHPLVLVDRLAVRRDDAGAFLAAVLKREESEIGQSRGLLVAVHGKDTAFFPRSILCHPIVAHHDVPDSFAWKPAARCRQALGFFPLALWLAACGLSAFSDRCTR